MIERDKLILTIVPGTIGFFTGVLMMGALALVLFGSTDWAVIGAIMQGVMLGLSQKALRVIPSTFKSPLIGLIAGIVIGAAVLAFEVHKADDDPGNLPGRLLPLALIGFVIAAFIPLEQWFKRYLK